jgi:diketogulonate reductase-like aldo/keto reductase
MTPSQVLLAWNVARGNVCVIPKSVTPARQRENLDGVANSTRLPKEHHDAVGSFIRE